MMLKMTGCRFKALLSALRSPHFGAGSPSANVIRRHIHHAVTAPAATIARQASKNKAPNRKPNIIEQTSNQNHPDSDEILYTPFPAKQFCMFTGNRK
jgi:hypothetical protein